MQLFTYDMDGSDWTRLALVCKLLAVAELMGIPF